MASVEEICSLALSFLGEPPISDITDTSDEASIRCSVQYPFARNAVLEMHPWRFATKRVALEMLSETPEYKFLYAYGLPSDLLKAQEVLEDEDDSEEVIYSIEFGKLLSDAETVYLRYTALIEETGRFSNLFAMTVAAKLSMLLSARQTKSNADLQKAQELFVFYLNEAKALDSSQGLIEDTYGSNWIDARRI